MRTKRATRFNHQNEHNSFGIYNWFTLKGIYDKEVMNEVIYAFLLSNNLEWLTPKTSEISKLNYVGKNFQKFASFGVKYLKENNYL